MKDNVDSLRVVLENSLTTSLATERAEVSGDTVKKFLALCLIFGCPNQNVRDTCTVKRH